MSVPGGAEELPLIDHRTMSDWCDDLEPADVLDLLARVPDESRRCVDEIIGAADAGNVTAAKRAAHRLKGMASSLGAARLSGMARRVELESIAADDVRAFIGALRSTLDETVAALRLHAQSIKP